MKICPKCRAEFEEKFNFCLQDGTALVDAAPFTNPDDEHETVVRRSAPSAQDIPDEEDYSPVEGTGLPQSAVKTEVWESRPTDEAGLSEIAAEPDGSSDAPAGVAISGVHEPEADSEYPAPQRSYLGIIVGLVAIFGLLLLGIAVGSAYLYYRSRQQYDIASANTNQQTNPAANENAEIEFPYENAELPAGNTDTAANQSNTDNKETPSPSKTPTPSPTVTPSIDVPTRTQTPVKVTPTPFTNGTPRPTRIPSPVPTRTVISIPIRIPVGVVNGRATSLPKPEYPAAARAVRASGVVRVAVIISESGRVMSARAVSGHPLLRRAAERAAQKSSFRPTTLQGRPVQVSGVIVYNFRP